MIYGRMISLTTAEAEKLLQAIGDLKADPQRCAAVSRAGALAVVRSLQSQVEEVYARQGRHRPCKLNII